MTASVIDKIAGTTVNIAKTVSSGTTPNITATHTLDTSRTKMHSVLFSAGDLAVGDVIKVTALWEDDDGAATNKGTIYIGEPAAGTEMFNAGAAGNKAIHTEQFIYVNSATTVISFAQYNATGQGTSNSVPRSITGLDITAGFTLYIGCQLADIADTMTLHGYSVTLTKAK